MADQDVDQGTVDAQGQDLRVVPVGSQTQPDCLLLDNNHITKLDGLQEYTSLQKLSIAENQLFGMRNVAPLSNLSVLNLSSNRITAIEGLKDLMLLTWLSLASNQIKVLEGLGTNTKLQHLDVSGNQISTISNLGHLAQLTTLLLHDNKVATLRTVPNHLPRGLLVVSLANNKLADLSEVGYLTTLSSLQQVSLLGNPCVVSTSALLAFDYRSYVVNWCLSLRFLDGYPVTEEEALKAEWLYSQGKGRHFRPGQHWYVVQYLTSVCPLTAPKNQSNEEEEHLSRILHQQRLHQLQLEQEQENRAPTVLSSSPPNLSPGHARSPRTRSPGTRSPAARSPRALHAKTARKTASPSPTSSPKAGSVGCVEVPTTEEQLEDCRNMSSLSPVSASVHRGGPLRAWHNNNVRDVSSPSSRPMAGLGSIARNDIHLHDVSSSVDETASMLEADTRYLPLNADLNVSPLRPFNFNFSGRPQTAPPASDTDNAQPSSFGELYGQRLDVEKRVAASVDVTSARRLPSPSSACRELNYDEQDGHHARPSSRVSRLAANIALQHKSPDAIKPKHSNSHPQPHVRKRSISPVTRAQDFPSNDDDRSSETNSSLTMLKLEELRAAIMASRKRKSRDTTRSSMSSPYLSQYSPEKYSTPTRRSLHQSSHTEKSEDCVGRDRSHPAPADAGYQPPGSHHSPHVDILPVHQDYHYHAGVRREAERAETHHKDKEQSLAATKLQATWRGFRARDRDPNIIKVRNEIRSRRAEVHIRNLELELERQKKLYDEEKQLRTMQLQVLNYLCQQVQSIQQWQINVQMSHDQSGNSLPAATSPAAPAATLPDLKLLLQHMEKASSSAPSGTSHTHRLVPDVTASPVSTQTTASTSKELELEGSCDRLQRQVSQLQELLTHMSHYVFQGGVISTDKEDTGDGGTIRLSSNFEQDTLAEVTMPTQSQLLEESGRCSVSLASHQRAPPAAGVPTAPQDLRVQQYGSCSVVLQWTPSVILGQNGKQISKPIMGYRIYVDQQAKGMVAGTQTRALLEGLQSSLPYRISVRAVSALGESADSNLVLVSPESESEESSKSLNSQPPDDSDRDPEEDRGKQGPASDGSSSNKTSGGGGGSGSAGNSDNKPSSPGGRHGNSSSGSHDNSGSTQASLLSSPKAGSITTPQASTPKQKTVHKSAVLLNASNTQSDKAQKTDGTSQPHEKSRTRPTVLQQLEKLEHDLSSPKQRGKTSPGRSLAEERNNRRSRSGSSEPELESKGQGREVDGDRFLAAGSPRVQEGLMKGLGEMKLTSKMLKRKTSPADPHKPLRAFNDLHQDTRSRDQGEVVDGKPRLTQPSKIPMFRAGDNSEQRRSSFDSAPMKSSQPLARSQSAGSLAGGTPSTQVNRHDLRPSQLGANTRATKSDSKLDSEEPDLARSLLSKQDSDTDNISPKAGSRRSSAHFKYSSDSSPEREHRLPPSREKDALRRVSSSDSGVQRRRQCSGSSQDLDHSGETKTRTRERHNSGEGKTSGRERHGSGEGKTSTRERHGSGGSTQDLELSGSGSGSKSGSNPAFDPKPPDSPRAGSLSRRNSFKRKKDKEKELASKDGDSSLSPASTGGTGTDTAGSLSSGGLPLEVNVIVNSHHDSQDEGPSPQGTGGTSFSDQSSVSPANTQIPAICHDFSSGADSESEKPLKRQTRGRSSARVLRKKVEKTERRSSSVGALVHRLAGGCCSAHSVVVANKPPLGKPAQSRGAEVDQNSGNVVNKHRSPSREELVARKTSRRRTKSEQNTMSSSEDEDNTQRTRRTRAEGHSKKRSEGKETPSKQKQDSKTTAAHRRCNSDLVGIQVLPDHPEHPGGRDRGTPSTPTQAPNSPRVRRSSSFSKALGSSSEKEQEPVVRKNFSIKELKAAFKEERKQIVQHKLGGERGEPRSSAAKTTAASTKQDVENLPTKEHNNKTNEDEDSRLLKQDDSVTASSKVSEQKQEQTTGNTSTGPSSRIPTPSNPLRRSDSTGKVHDLIQQFSSKTSDGKTAVQRRSSMKETSRPVAGSASDLGIETLETPHSPKVAGKQIDAKNRPKTKLRAAELFAKLQMKLSPKS